MLSWLAGRRSPSVVHLLTDDPLAALSAPADKQQTVYAVSRVNPVFKEEAWPTGMPAAGEDERTGWQQSAADGSTYWHEPPPDSSLRLEPPMEPADDPTAAAADTAAAAAAAAAAASAAAAAAAAAAAGGCGPPDSLELPPASPVAARRFVEYRGAPPPPMYSEVADVHRGPRVHHGMSLHRGMDLHRGPTAGRSATLPRPVWPSSVGGPAGSEAPRRLSVSGYMTVADHIGSSWPAPRQLPPRGADGRFILERRATFPPARTGFAERLPSIPDEEDVEPPADGQPDSIVTEALLQLTTPRSTPAGSVRDGAREGDGSHASLAAERAESFHWEAASSGGGMTGGVAADTTRRLPPPLPPLAAPPAGFNWSRTLEPLMQVLWSGEESPPVLRRSRETLASTGDQPDVESALPLPWRGSEAGSVVGSPAGVAVGVGGHYPAPPSRASSELSQLYAELAAPRPISRALSEELYAWPVFPPVAVPEALLERPPPPPRSESPPPAYLNQLLPSDSASDCGQRRSRLGSDASGRYGRTVHRTPSDARSDASRHSQLSGSSRGSRSHLLPSDSSEGGSERRVTFSADTVDNEPGPARPRPRRLPARGAGPGPARPNTTTKTKGFYAANVLSRLTGANHKTGEKKELEFRNFTVDVGRVAAMRRQAARRWRSRHLCSAITVVLVLVLLLAAGVLIAWLWTTERRLFRV